MIRVNKWHFRQIQWHKLLHFYNIGIIRIIILVSKSVNDAVDPSDHAMISKWETTSLTLCFNQAKLFTVQENIFSDKLYWWYASVNAVVTVVWVGPSPTIGSLVTDLIICFYRLWGRTHMKMKIWSTLIKEYSIPPMLFFIFKQICHYLLFLITMFMISQKQARNARTSFLESVYSLSQKFKLKDRTQKWYLRGIARTDHISYIIL